MTQHWGKCECRFGTITIFVYPLLIRCPFSWWNDWRPMILPGFLSRCGWHLLDYLCRLSQKFGGSICEGLRSTIGIAQAKNRLHWTVPALSTPDQCDRWSDKHADCYLAIMVGPSACRTASSPAGRNLKSNSLRDG